MFSYKYCLNTITLTVSKPTATLLSYYHINITLPLSQVPSENTQLQSCHIIIEYYLISVTRTFSKQTGTVILSYKFYLNTVTRPVSKYTATLLSCYHINITLTQSHVPSVITHVLSFHIII